MNRFLMLIAVTVALDVFAPVVRAQNYVVNGHPATSAEVQLLSSYGARPGHWVVNGSGFVAVDETQAVAAVNRSCRQSRLLVPISMYRAASDPSGR